MSTIKIKAAHKNALEDLTECCLVQKEKLEMQQTGKVRQMHRQKDSQVD